MGKNNGKLWQCFCAVNEMIIIVPPQLFLRLLLIRDAIVRSERMPCQREYRHDCFVK